MHISNVKLFLSFFLLMSHVVLRQFKDDIKKAEPTKQNLYKLGDYVMFLICSSNKEPKVIMKTKCCTVMTHVCTKMKQKGIATAEKRLNFQDLIKVVHFSIKLIQLYLI